MPKEGRRGPRRPVLPIEGKLRSRSLSDHGFAAGPGVTHFERRRTSGPLCGHLAPGRLLWHTARCAKLILNSRLSTPVLPPANLPAEQQPRHAAGTNLPTYVFQSSGDLARHVAQIVAGIIRDRGAQGQAAVLG